MLLPYERVGAFTTYIVPILCTIPSLGLLLPGVREKMQKNYIVQNVSFGVLMPGTLQLALIFGGGLIMEALEMQAEEDAHYEWVAWMRHANQTAPSLYPDLVKTLGDPDAWPWRNWDIYGSTFYCFTLMTTIGYGTFAPVTTGGKLFSACFAFVAIPIAAWTYGSLGRCIVHGLFHPLIMYRLDIVSNSWPTFDEADMDGQGVSKQEAILAVHKSRLWIGKPTILDFIHATVEDGQHLSAAEYGNLGSRVMDICQESIELMVALILMLLFVILSSSLYVMYEGEGTAPADAIYFTIITFTTVGLGDKTMDYSTRQSLHGNFHWGSFLFVSSGLALIAAVIQNVAVIGKNLWGLMLPKSRTTFMARKSSINSEELPEAVKSEGNQALEVTGNADTLERPDDFSL